MTKWVRLAFIGATIVVHTEVRNERRASGRGSDERRRLRVRGRAQWKRYDWTECKTTVVTKWVRLALIGATIMVRSEWRYEMNGGLAVVEETNVDEWGLVARNEGPRAQWKRCDLTEGKITFATKSSRLAQLWCQCKEVRNELRKRCSGGGRPTKRIVGKKLGCFLGGGRSVIWYDWTNHS